MQSNYLHGNSITEKQSDKKLVLFFHHGKYNSCIYMHTYINTPTRPKIKVYQWNAKIEIERERIYEEGSTSLRFLSRRTTPLKNLEVDETKRHETEGKTGHNAGEEDEETRDSGVDEPPHRSEGYAFVAKHRERVVPRQHPSHH